MVLLEISSFDNMDISLTSLVPQLCGLRFNPIQWHLRPFVVSSVVALHWLEFCEWNLIAGDPCKVVTHS